MRWLWVLFLVAGCRAGAEAEHRDNATDMRHTSHSGSGRSMILPPDGELPEYCGAVKGPGPLRRIPPLMEETQKLKPVLLQTQAIIRHGARTPTSNHFCWAGYKPKWNCKVQEAVVGIDPRPGRPEAPDTGSELERRELAESSDWKGLFHHSSGGHSNAVFSTESRTFMFPKLYDVHPASNVFHGNCLEGQLVDEGFNQHLDNGRELAEVYFQLGPDPYRVPYPGAPPLIDLNAAFNKAVAHSRHKDKVLREVADPVHSENEYNSLSIFPNVPLPEIYFRSTDMQRTRLSGATLISSTIRHTIGVESDKVHWDIPLHTMDMIMDTMAQHTSWCPVLRDIRMAAYRSSEFLKMRQANIRLGHQAAPILGLSQAEFEESWKRDGGRDLMDCLMTSICSGRTNEIPSGIGPYTGLYKSLMQAVDDENTFLYLWNDSLFAKTAISQLMNEVKENIVQAYISFSGDATADLTRHFGDDPTVREVMNSEARRPSKESRARRLAVYSGHDTTILPFLCSLGSEVFPGTWPPYASIIVIELFQIKSELYFRIVYNGNILNKGIPGCAPDKDLCLVKHFFSATSWARPEMRCPETLPELLSQVVA